MLEGCKRSSSRYIMKSDRARSRTRCCRAKNEFVQMHSEKFDHVAEICLVILYYIRLTYNLIFTTETRRRVPSCCRSFYLSVILHSTTIATCAFIVACSMESTMKRTHFPPLIIPMLYVFKRQKVDDHASAGPQAYQLCAF